MDRRCMDFTEEFDFTRAQAMKFPLRELRERVSALAKEGVYVGTSSWKYEGWASFTRKIAI